jgi:polyphenol oxidase
VSTTRGGGVSSGAFASLNLGDHVGDEPSQVARNRFRLSRYLELPAEPCWLSQVHGREVVAATNASSGCQADASVTDAPGTVCVVMTADCLPLLVCDDEGRRVSAIHGGWRGLLGGVVDSAVLAMRVPPERLMVWLGPAIGPDAFEVGSEVRDGFCTADPAAAAAFRPSSPTGRAEGRWLADIFLLARQRLMRLGIERIYGGGDCTFSQPQRFFSYRRDGVTGRMASLIWLA